ncbi:MAG: rod-binding protein [Lachnospiraceae bacterium]|nr:rod-binding protein [Lachnospiraceae bacterium]
MTDFSNITGMYSDMYSTAANQSASSLQNKLTDADYSKASDTELMDACKQFEAYFIEQMYKGMMKTIPQSEETSNYTSSMMDFYKDKMIQSVAEETSDQNGGFGLAQMLYEQMKRNFGVSEVPVAEEMEAAATE